MAEVALIYLPVGEHGVDQGVDEYLAAGHTIDDLLGLRTPDLREQPEGSDEPEEPETQSAYLVRYAEEGDLFYSPNDEAFATVPVAEHRETHAVASEGFKLWLRRRFYEEHGRPPGSQALQDALGVLEAKALFDGEEHPVHVRIADHDGTIYVDLANEARETVKITPEGVEVVSDPPVRFRRRKGMLALPHPVGGEGVEDLPRKQGERRKRLFRKKPANDRHERHERHAGQKADGEATPTDDGDDGDVTLSTDEGAMGRHGESPIEKPDSAGRDADDAHDDELQPDSEAIFITTDDDLRASIPEIQEAEAVALDSESTGLDPRKHQIRLLQIATEGGTWIIDNFSVDIEPLLEILKDKTLIVHNAMHDLLFLRKLGYRHEGQVVDTMTLSRMAHAGQRDEGGKRLEHSLEACCKRELDLTLDKSHQNEDWSGEISDEMLAYASEDTRVLLPLYETLKQRLLETGQGRVLEIEQRALLAGIEMAHNGVPVDRERWLGIVEEAGEKLGELRDHLDGLVGEPPEEIRKRNAKNKNVPEGRKGRWNWDSPEQIKAAAGIVGVPLEKTSMDYLKVVGHEFTKALLAYREAKSGLATFGEKYFEPTEEGREVYLDGRLYPSWSMCQADTGRMSCSSPNVQNVPNKSRLGRLRECVIAPEGRRLIRADYSQIELRIVAKIAGEEAMLEAYRKDEDLHRRTARSITGREEVTKQDRQLAKAVNFGLLYGQGAKGLRDYARDKYGPEMSPEEAAQYRERWFWAYPAIRTWHRTEGIGFGAGEDVARTLTGRTRRVKTFTEKVNHPVQGTGADGLKLAMALFHERLAEHLEAKIVIACHDELVVECPEEQAEEVARFLEEVMVVGMDEVLNPGLDEAHPEWVPVEVEAEILESWGA